MCDLPTFCHILRDEHGLCLEGSATLCRHGDRSEESTTKSACIDESHPNDSGGFYGTSPRNLSVIYGVNGNLAPEKPLPLLLAANCELAYFPRTSPSGQRGRGRVLVPVEGARSCVRAPLAACPL